MPKLGFVQLLFAPDHRWIQMMGNHGAGLCLLKHLIAIPFGPQHHGLDMEMRFLRGIVNANQHLILQ